MARDWKFLINVKSITAGLRNVNNFSEINFCERNVGSETFVNKIDHTSIQLNLSAVLQRNVMRDSVRKGAINETEDVDF